MAQAAGVDPEVTMGMEVISYEGRLSRCNRNNLDFVTWKPLLLSCVTGQNKGSRQ